MAIELAARQYAMMSPAQRVEVARQIAACPGLEWDGAFVGLAKLPAFRRGGIDLVLVPGGSFTMGLGAEEMQALLRMPGLRPGSPGESTWRPIVERWAARAAGPRGHGGAVSVRPGAAARRADRRARARIAAVPRALSRGAIDRGAAGVRARRRCGGARGAPRRASAVGGGRLLLSLSRSSRATWT